MSREGGRPVGGPLSVTVLRWWVGTFCAFLGAFMVVSPDHFTSPAYAALVPAVPLWGIAFLIGGWGMLAAAATRPRPWVYAAAHLVVAVVFGLLAGGLASVGGWSGTLVYGVLSFGIVVSALRPPRSVVEPAERRRGDLFALLVGISQVLLGLWLLVFGRSLSLDIYPAGGLPRGVLALLLILTGVPLAVVQLRPGGPRRRARWAHLAAGAVLLVAVWYLAVPARSWTGMVFYGSGGLLIGLLPWLRYRLRTFDPGSLAARLSLVLAAAASLPVVVTLGVVEAGRPPGESHQGLGILALVVVLVSAAVVLGVSAARVLAEPLRRLSEAADRLAAGEPAVPLEGSGVSELDRLSANFRSMRNRLAERSEETRSLAVELRRRADELADAARRKDEFLAMLAHELRNPLGAITNAAHLLDGIDADDPRIVRPTRVIQRQSSHLARLVEDLLDVSRITRGKVELQRSRLDLVEVVRRTVEAAGPGVEAAGLALHLELPPHPVPVNADPTRLEQVLGNLVSNAVKYTEAGGRVTLQVETAAPSPGAAGSSPEAVVRVVDTGIGMPPELLPHVFDLFTQGERGLDRRTGGLGIGLTLVHRLVTLHGGRVRAHSEGVGRGSELEVRLPLAP